MNDIGNMCEPLIGLFVSVRVVLFEINCEFSAKQLEIDNGYYYIYIVLCHKNIV